MVPIEQAVVLGIWVHFTDTWAWSEAGKPVSKRSPAMQCGHTERMGLNMGRL
jgi:hypothetical protein